MVNENNTKLKVKDIYYVLIQALLLMAYFVVRCQPTATLPYILKIATVIMASIGVFIILVAMVQLNKSLTPFPSPRTNGILIDQGLYKYVRHPIYTGILVFVFSYSIYELNYWKFGISIALLVFFYYKSIYEESQLEEKFPQYKAYKSTTGRFFPTLK